MKKDLKKEERMINRKRYERNELEFIRQKGLVTEYFEWANREDD